MDHPSFFLSPSPPDLGVSTFSSPAREKLAGISIYDKRIRMHKKEEDKERWRLVEERRKKKGLAWMLYEPKEPPHESIPKVCSRRPLLVYRAQRGVIQPQHATPHVAPSPPLQFYTLHVLASWKLRKELRSRERNWQKFPCGFCVCVNSTEREVDHCPLHPTAPSSQ